MCMQTHIHVYTHDAYSPLSLLQYSPLLMFLSDGESTDDDGDNEMCQIKKDFGFFGLQVKTLGFGSDATDRSIVAKLTKLAELAGGDFLQAIDGVQLKQCFEKAAASLAHRY